MPTITPWERHVSNWHKCTLCGLCKGREKVVLLRGSLPAPILFIGEGPGESEEILGLPFIGPVGKWLDWIIEKARIPKQWYAITNLVGCVPREEYTNNVTEPPDWAIKACLPRVTEVIILCQPKLIICVGGHAKRHTPKALAEAGLDYQPSMVDIIHPGAVLKLHAMQQPLAWQRSVATVEEAVDTLIEEGLLSSPWGE